MPYANRNADRIAFDRRTYLKKSTLAGSAIGRDHSCSATICLACVCGGTETIKVGLIGCGGRGAGAAVQALSTGMDVKLWAMADAFDRSLGIESQFASRGEVVNRKLNQDTSVWRCD